MSRVFRCLMPGKGWPRERSERLGSDLLSQEGEPDKKRSGGPFPGEREVATKRPTWPFSPKAKKPHT